MDTIEPKNTVKEGRKFLQLISNSFLTDTKVHVAVVGSNFKTTPINQREKLAKAITLDSLLRLKHELQDEPELILLSTCNRVEIYLAGVNLNPILESFVNLFSELLQIQSKELEFYSYVDLAAIMHLFEVASGLDSLVLGEAQILLQVSDAAKKASQLGLAGEVLMRLFAKAYSVGREIRNSYPEFTNGFKNSVINPVLHVIEDYLKTETEPRFLHRKPNLLLIGSGKMIRLTIKSLSKSIFGNVILATRSVSASKQLSGVDHVAQLSQLNEIFESIPIDVVIVATSSDSYILSQSQLIQYLNKDGQSNSKLLIIDISFPRNVDPKLAEYKKNVILYNIDDLGKVLAAGQDSFEEGKIQFQPIRNLLISRCEEFVSWLIEISQITPIMDSLRRKAERIRMEELKNVFSRITELAPSEKEVIEIMSERLVRRLLHEPTSKLKETLRRKDYRKSKALAMSIAELFNVDTVEENCNSEQKENLVQSSPSQREESSNLLAK